MPNKGLEADQQRQRNTRLLINFWGKLWTAAIAVLAILSLAPALLSLSLIIDGFTSGPIGFILGLASMLTTSDWSEVVILPIVILAPIWLGYAAYRLHRWRRNWYYEGEPPETEYDWGWILNNKSED